MPPVPRICRHRPERSAAKEPHVCFWKLGVSSYQNPAVSYVHVESILHRTFPSRSLGHTLESRSPCFGRPDHSGIRATIVHFAQVCRRVTSPELSNKHIHERIHPRGRQFKLSLPPETGRKHFNLGGGFIFPSSHTQRLRYSRTELKLSTVDAIRLPGWWYEVSVSRHTTRPRSQTPR